MTLCRRQVWLYRDIGQTNITWKQQKTWGVCGADLTWGLEACGAGMLPVSSALITCQPAWPRARRFLPCDLLPVLNELLIKLEREIN